MNIKKHIPNALTCSNLLCGCIAIVQAMNGNLVSAAYLVGLAAVFDFFDGFAARLLKVSSPIGKDLDSLADMVTFGVVPGIVMFQMLANHFPTYEYNQNTTSVAGITSSHKVIFVNLMSYTKYLAMIIPIFSALRLAKFNNDPRQSDSFIGVPTPANAIFICSVALILNMHQASPDIHFNDNPEKGLTEYIQSISNNTASKIEQVPYSYAADSTTPLLKSMNSPYFLLAVTIVFAFLLVSEIPLIALKFKHFKWKGNEIRFIFIALCILLLSILQLVGIPLCIVLYILVSLINNLLVKKARHTA